MSDTPTFFSFCHWALNQRSYLGHMLDKLSTSERCLACSWLLIYSISHVPSWFPHQVCCFSKEAHPYLTFITTRRICYLPVLWLFANHGWDSPLGPFPPLSSFPVSMVAGSKSSKCIVINLEQGLACYLMSSWVARMWFVIGPVWRPLPEL